MKEVVRGVRQERAREEQIIFEEDEESKTLDHRSCMTLISGIVAVGVDQRSEVGSWIWESYHGDISFFTLQGARVQR